MMNKHSYTVSNLYGWDEYLFLFKIPKKYSQGDQKNIFLWKSLGNH